MHVAWGLACMLPGAERSCTLTHAPGKWLPFIRSPHAHASSPSPLRQALNKFGHPDYFQEEDVRLMQTFCNEVAYALKRKSVETALSKITADRGDPRDRVGYLHECCRA